MSHFRSRSNILSWLRGCVTKTSFFIFVSIILTPNIHAQAQWVRSMGGSGSDVGIASTADASGNVYSIGTFSGTAQFGQYPVSAIGKGDIFITKIKASDGSVTWVKQFGAQDEDHGNAICSDPAGNIYFTGRFSGVVVFGTFTLTSVGGADSFLAKLDATTGLVIWARRTGGTGNDGGLRITTDGAGNIYTSGYFQGLATFGTFTLTPAGPNFNIFLARTDGTSGNVIWAKGYGNTGYAFGSSISCDASGDVYMTGYFEGNVPFDSYTLSAANYQDIFVSRHLASTGNVDWAISAGGPGNDNGTAIVAGSDGFVYTTGKFEESCAFGTTTLVSQGNADVFVSKREALNGNLVWAKRFGGASFEQANAIALDAQGRIFITGQFNGYPTFGNTVLASEGNADIFIAELGASAGTAVWVYAMGGTNADSGYGVSIGAGNELYCTGSFQLNARLAGFEAASKGLSDIFIVSINREEVGIAESSFLNNSISVKPIPVKEKLSVTLKEIPAGNYKLLLGDLTGNTLLELSVSGSNQELDLGKFLPGIYYLKVQFPNGSFVVKKIIKEN